ncbi:hypothetical protein SS50377_25573 [Spironucleus salmonicida]|nr:hypothetical protein SS50377_25573 [Spironucleus salmonicida]
MDLSFDVDNDHIEVLDVQKLHQLINKNTEQQYVTLSRIPSLLDQQNNISPVQLPPLHPQQIRVNNSVEHMVGNFSERLSSQVSYNSTELTEPLVNNVSIFNIGQSEKESTRNFDEPNNSSNKAEPPQSTQKIDTLDMADINVDFYFDEL